MAFWESVWAKCPRLGILQTDVSLAGMPSFHSVLYILGQMQKSSPNGLYLAVNSLLSFTLLYLYFSPRW